MFVEQRGGAIVPLPGIPGNSQTYLWQHDGRHLLSDGATEQRDGPPVTGLIFHLSRCGSTLLARLLACAPETLVLNEPDVVNSLLRIREAEPRPTAKASPAIREAVRVIAAGSHPDARQIVIKTTSWNVFHARSLMATFPAARVVFLSREPAEILASLARRPPAWASRIPGGQPAGEAEEPLVDSYAVELRAFVEAAECAMAEGPDRWRTAQYKDLPALCASVADWFGVSESEVRAGIGGVARTHSKSGAPWSPQPEQPAPTHALVEAAARVTLSLARLERSCSSLPGVRMGTS